MSQQSKYQPTIVELVGVDAHEEEGEEDEVDNANSRTGLRVLRKLLLLADRPAFGLTVMELEHKGDVFCCVIFLRRGVIPDVQLPLLVPPLDFRKL